MNFTRDSQMQPLMQFMAQQQQDMQQFMAAQQAQFAELLNRLVNTPEPPTQVTFQRDQATGKVVSALIQ